MLLPNVRDAGAVLRAMRELGLATDAREPQARLIACTGSAGCAKGLADTKADALALAPLMPSGAVVHLSGCPRSCAAAHVAPFTLLAVAPGRYDLFQPGLSRLPVAVEHADRLDPATMSFPVAEAAGLRESVYLDENVFRAGPDGVEDAVEALAKIQRHAAELPEA